MTDDTCYLVSPAKYRRYDAPMTSVAPADLAGPLRLHVTRLSRLLRQQDQSGFAPALATALATIGREGPITLSRLAAEEHVTPPTVTKLVDRLEERGFVSRRIDPTDRRVCRVTITRAGVKQLESIRVRRTAWLADRLSSLPADDLERLVAAIDVLEALARPPSEMRS